jgi:predicted nucleic acid-binding protein
MSRLASLKTSARLLELPASAPDIEVLPPTIEQFRAGATLHASRPDKGWSLTDCSTFSVMNDRGWPTR